MNNFTVDTACRICLEDGVYSIFESNQHFEGLHSKFPEFLKEKIKDITGYPRKICLKCYNDLEIMNNFINKFEETHKKLQKKIITVKIEVEDSIYKDNHNLGSPFSDEFKIQNIVKYESKVEKKDPIEILESLAHNLTIKKIQVESDSTNKDSMDIENKDTIKTKQGKNKSAVSTKAKKVAKKPMVVKKPPKGNNKLPKGPTADGTNRLAITLFKSQTKITQIAPEKTSSVPTPKLCDLCGETFHETKELAKHKIKIHSEGRFKCTKCPKDYANKYDLYRHGSMHHEKIKNAICDICGKAYEKSRLKQHILMSHMKDPNKKRVYKLHKCQFCDRTYTYKLGVIIHERSVHTGERPAVCDVCNSAFYHKVYLVEHMRIHTGVAPFECPICRRGFTQRGNMKSHMRNHRISDLSAETRSKLKPSYLKFMRP